VNTDREIARCDVRVVAMFLACYKAIGETRRQMDATPACGDRPSLVGHA
jgi:hypothetical protein